MTDFGADVLARALRAIARAIIVQACAANSLMSAERIVEELRKI